MGSLVIRRTQRHPTDIYFFADSLSVLLFGVGGMPLPPRNQKEAEKIIDQNCRVKRYPDENIGSRDRLPVESEAVFKANNINKLESPLLEE